MQLNPSIEQVSISLILAIDGLEDVTEKKATIQYNKLYIGNPACSPTKNHMRELFFDHIKLMNLE